MSDSLTVLSVTVLVSVYVGQSHCVSLFLVSFSLCRTVSLCWSMPMPCLFQSMSDSLTVLVYSLLVSVYVGQSHCVSLCLVSFSLCRTVSLC